MAIREITAKSALHYHTRLTSANWDINPYRDCGHQCIYCFAQYSHKYIGSDQFFDEILVKTNIAEVLSSDFSRRTWKRVPVNLCGVTDGYQPLEKKYTLTRKIIQIFIKYRNPLIITTKSTLLLRDIDLLEELNKVARVDIYISASTTNESIRKKIEPLAPPTKDRLEMLGEFSKRGIHTEILIMPIIPYLTDDFENLEEIFRMGKENGAKRIVSQALNLRGDTKSVFFEYLKDLFPDLLPKIASLYKRSCVEKIYLETIRQKVRFLRKKYNFYNKICEPASCRSRCIQLNLFR